MVGRIHGFWLVQIVHCMGNIMQNICNMFSKNILYHNTRYFGSLPYSSIINSNIKTIKNKHDIFNQLIPKKINISYNMNVIFI